jgi:hypothetical protein
VRCPLCIQDGFKSRVEFSKSLHFEPPPREPHIFFDEDGHPHEHDAPSSVHRFQCSRDHLFSVKTFKPCWCRPGKNDPVVTIHAFIESQTAGFYTLLNPATLKSMFETSSPRTMSPEPMTKVET